ncbi:MAG: ABC transporter ATP-binding protein [Waddliaceae bacterium]
MKQFLIEAKNLHKTFDSPTEIRILKGVDLNVSYGESVAITGRSGEGKSTLLHILGTLESYSQGGLKVAGYDVSRYKKTLLRNLHMGFVFQSFHLLEDYTVLENILMPARIGRYKGATRSEVVKRGMDRLDFVGLTDRAYFNVRQLSGGEKQRVAIGRALCNDPDVIFADEPSGNLDKKNAEIIHDLLLTYVKQEDKGLVVVTHDQQLANLCDTQYHLQNGLLHVSK